MLKVAKYLGISKSVYMPREEARYFNISEVDSGRSLPLLQLEGTRRDGGAAQGPGEGWLSTLLFGWRR